MNLTKEEFSLFNIKSKAQLLKTDGRRINLRIANGSSVITLYRIYDFLIEAVYDLQEQQFIRIDPVLRGDVLVFYSDDP